MVVFTVVFGKLAKMSSSSDIPYPLLVFAGMLPWQFFSSALGDASNSLTNNANLISKVYFPRLIVPDASCCKSSSNGRAFLDVGANYDYFSLLWSAQKKGNRAFTTSTLKIFITDLPVTGERFGRGGKTERVSKINCCASHPAGSTSLHAI
jgi:hypothetical protein